MDFCARDRRSNYFVRRREETQNIWMRSLKDGEERALTHFTGRRRGRLSSRAFATDDRYLYFGWHDATGDLWLMDVVTEDK